MLYCVKYTKRELDNDGNIIKQSHEKTYGIGASCNEAIDFAIKHKGFDNTANTRYCDFNAFTAARFEGPYRLYNATWKTPRMAYLNEPFYTEEHRIVIGRDEQEAWDYAEAYIAKDSFDLTVEEVKEVCGARYEFLPNL